jgi:hypothetical protein
VSAVNEAKVLGTLLLFASIKHVLLPRVGVKRLSHGSYKKTFVQENLRT